MTLDASLPLFYCEDALLEEGRVVTLPPGEARHARSRRLEPGMPVGVVNGRGMAAGGRLTGDGLGVLLEFLEARLGEPAQDVCVFVGAAEHARMEWAVEKGTECGARGFWFVSTERSQRAHAAALASRRSRLLRIAAEAVKQCRRSLRPFIEGPVSFREALSIAPAPLFVASFHAEPETIQFSGPASLFVGPEGGFSQPELDAFRDLGAQFFSLGSRILRVETAVTAALTRLVKS